MISEFFDSWSLFADSYLAGWLVAALLALVGVIVVARDQIFLGAAVAQASTLGIAIAMIAGAWVGESIDEHTLAGGMAVLFAVAAAVVTAYHRDNAKESHEATTGWVFLAASALAILVVTHSPHGLDEVQHLLASSIIGATRSDVWLFASLGVLTTVGVGVTHRTLRLLVMDTQTAAAMGVRVGWWSLVIAVWLGLTLGLSLRSSGMLYSFGCLVLPALVAKSTCRTVGAMFFVAPVVALLAAVIAFVLANHYDWPPAQAAVALMALLMIPAWAWRRWRGA
ncbi:MAG: iron chelate uptake ABC transporter family permease subunit [Phycisphaera sp.]|nr:iron chelate uptake ABC transporter family permease subunit [Phycisphaera sp.]